IDRTDDMIPNLIHLKKADANGASGDAANFRDRDLETFGRKMFKEIVNDAQVKGFISSSDLEHVADLEPDLWEQHAGIVDILRAEIESGVIEITRQSVSIQEAVIICRATRRFQYRHWWSQGLPLLLVLVKRCSPHITEHVETSVRQGVRSSGARV